MMARYQTKPGYVDAVQWFKHGDHPAVKTSVSGDFPAGSIMVEGKAAGWLDDPDGGITGKVVKPGDWIVTDQAGDHHAMSSEDFDRTFEAVTE